MEREDTNGTTDKFFKDNGKVGVKAAMEFGIHQTETAMLEIG